MLKMSGTSVLPSRRMASDHHRRRTAALLAAATVSYEISCWGRPSPADTNKLSFAASVEWRRSVRRTRRWRLLGQQRTDQRAPRMPHLRPRWLRCGPRSSNRSSRNLTRLTLRRSQWRRLHLRRLIIRRRQQAGPRRRLLKMSHWSRTACDSSRRTTRRSLPQWRQQLRQHRRNQRVGSRGAISSNNQ